MGENDYGSTFTEKRKYVIPEDPGGGEIEVTADILREVEVIEKMACIRPDLLSNKRVGKKGS